VPPTCHTPNPMNTKLLIDAVVRQTTVLIAELSTLGGVRAPLAHLADQVFLSLSREIEAQGVGRKVAADMFGMALRSYQRKTQRLAQSSTEQGKTLVEAVLEYVERERGATRQMILGRFKHDGERETAGVLNDLVQSGLVYTTGSGSGALYGVTSDAERQRFTRHSDRAARANMLVGEVYRAPGLGVEELAARFGLERALVLDALEDMLADGRVTREGTGFCARSFQLDEDTPGGWESAVFDHFQAMTTAVANKLQWHSLAAEEGRWIGGSTMRFELHATHPLKQEALDLLRATRERVEELWQRIADTNDQNPRPVEGRATLTFYFGQNVDDPTALTEIVGD
jgi:hypothetical protein